MNPEWALICITIIGAIGTGVNVWITLYTSKQILGLKLWVQTNFVAKDDMSTYISPLKDSVQMLYSQGRLSKER
jgi:hypothetical protein